MRFGYKPQFFKSALSFILLLGAMACSPSSDDVEITVNVGVPVRAHAPVNLSKTLLSLMAVNIGQDCYQNEVQLALMDKDNNQIIATKKVMMRSTLIGTPILYNGNSTPALATDVSSAINRITGASYFDEQLRMLVPKNKNIEIGFMGTFYNPVDFNKDGICDQKHLDTTHPSSINFEVSDQPLTSARQQHTATTLQDGRILVAGGEGMSAINKSSSQVYDPITRTWSPEVNFSDNVVRKNHTATLLNDGRVLVVGGNTASTTATASVQIFNPTLGNWSPGTALDTARYNHTATLLHGPGVEGMVLVVGGEAGGSMITTPADLVELYDPVNNNWIQITGASLTPRRNHTANFISQGFYAGKVLVMGGDNQSTIFSSVQIYDPATPGWSTAASPLNTQRTLHTANMLPNGDILIIGGKELIPGNPVTPANTVERYTSSSGAIIPRNGLPNGMYYHTTTVLPDGKIFVAGGLTGNTPSPNVTSNAFVADNDTDYTWTALNIPIAKQGHTASVLPGGQMIVVGGFNGSWSSDTDFTIFKSDAISSTSMIGHASVNSNTLNSGVINLNIQVLHTTPELMNYHADMIGNNTGRYRDWVELPDTSFISDIKLANLTLDKVSYLNSNGGTEIIQTRVNPNVSSGFYIPHMFPLTLEFNYVGTVASACANAIPPCFGRYRAIVNQADAVGTSLQAILIPGTASTKNPPWPTAVPSASPAEFRILTY